MKIKMPNLRQEFPASFKSPNQGLKNIDVLCTFKIKIVSQNSKHGSTKDQQPYQNQNSEANLKSGPSSLLQTPKLGLKNIDVLCTFKINTEKQNLEHGCINDQWPYPNQDPNAKPQSGNSSILQSPKWGLKGHGCSLHLQNQDREPKFGSLVYERPVTISKSSSLAQPKLSNH